jgi:hypothetical protein
VAPRPRAFQGTSTHRHHMAGGEKMDTPNGYLPGKHHVEETGLSMGPGNVDVDPRDCDRFHLGHLERDGAGRVGSI